MVHGGRGRICSFTHSQTKEHSKTCRQQQKIPITLIAGGGLRDEKEHEMAMLMEMTHLLKRREDEMSTGSIREKREKAMGLKNMRRCSREIPSIPFARRRDRIDGRILIV
ncbi:hypothetical protein CEXT_254991 [Caerostris extrusa]|uniref:Uncharacterized protein n=1 Tax=Caerostris extrusa TaxID=172846 RepID=A0AAV4RTR6_CAEEX|nr:hypothetical protein CEXT_254991 [Caerostris extrusa]